LIGLRNVFCAGCAGRSSLPLLLFFSNHKDTAGFGSVEKNSMPARKFFLPPKLAVMARMERSLGSLFYHCSIGSILLTASHKRVIPATREAPCQGLVLKLSQWWLLLLVAVPTTLATAAVHSRVNVARRMWSAPILDLHFIWHQF
jgi:hypothetical protein